ncbi:hypothetical protein BOX15_Mlig017401g2, partial [Macrostomum lignano]
RRHQLDRWGVFSLIEPELWDQISWAVVFGNNGSEAILVANREQGSDCRVLSVGTNSSGCLGLGDAQSCLNPTEIEALRGIVLVDLACGSGPHCLALTADGRLYCWGHNGYGQLGNGGTVQLLTPAPCAGLDDGVRVLSIACGGNHSLALVASCSSGGNGNSCCVQGEVFAWGQNNYGQVGCGAAAATQATPRRAGGSLASGRPVRIVACCQTSSFAVDEVGEVHAWGFNGSGQLGTGGCANQPLPIRLDNWPRGGVGGVSGAGGGVARLACGAGHVLAVSTSGRLFAWGANSHGQLGTGGKSNSSAPTAVNIPSGVGVQGRGDDVAAYRVLDIGAAHYSNLSTALVASPNGSGCGSPNTPVVFAWGHSRGQSLSVPVQTRFAELNDAFACLSSPAVTCRRLLLSGGCKPASDTADESSAPATVADSIRQAFDDPSTSDVTFRVDGRDIRAHRSLLRIRCRHFRSMLSDSWSEHRQEVIEVRDYSYSVYRAFLEYLYSDTVCLSPEDDHDASSVGLLDLANCYCETRLKSLCEELIEQRVNVDNALELYAAAIRFSAPTLEQFCFNFAVYNLSAVVSAESFSQLDEFTLKQFMRLAAKAGAFKY